MLAVCLSGACVIVSQWHVVGARGASACLLVATLLALPVVPCSPRALRAWRFFFQLFFALAPYPFFACIHIPASVIGIRPTASRTLDSGRCKWRRSGWLANLEFRQGIQNITAASLSFHFLLLFPRFVSRSACFFFPWYLHHHLPPSSIISRSVRMAVDRLFPPAASLTAWPINNILRHLLRFPSSHAHQPAPLYFDHRGPHGRTPQ